MGSADSALVAGGRPLDRLREANMGLLDTVRSLTDHDIGRASLLPGWTRGHVLAHLARNTEGLIRLVEWARTGVPRPMHHSAAAHEREIEQDAGRCAAEHLADLTATSYALVERLDRLEPRQESRVVTLANGVTLPAKRIAWHQLREVQVHHVDLAAGYTFDTCPADFLDAALRDALLDMSENWPPVTVESTDSGLRLDSVHGGTGGPVVRGSTADLVAWVLGRSPGVGLTSEDGPLPVLPQWL